MLASMPMLADTLSRAIYGGVVGSAGASDVSGQKPGSTEAAAQSNHGAGTGILWAAGILVVGLLVYGFVATGSGKGMLHQAGRSINQMTGGLIGKKPDDDKHNE